MEIKNIDKTIYQNYLIDLGKNIKDLALQAKQKSLESETDFSIGYMAGFHRVVSLMQQQAEAFGIPIEDIGLDEIDPDEELI